MSLIKRQPRPLLRDKGSFRDDRLFIVACDDTYAPKQYFGFFRLSRIQVHVVPTTDGTSTAERVLNRLLEIEHDDDDERWLLLDTDHHIKGEHFPKFVETIKEAEQRGIQVALSRPCFELWLLLHHVEVQDIKHLKNAAEVEALLRTTLGEYNKRRLKPEHYPLSLLAAACSRAARLDEEVGGGHIPEHNSSRVYRLWKSIILSAQTSQLPPELRGIF